MTHLHSLGHNYKASTIHEQRTDIFDLQTQQFLVKEVPDGRPDLSKALQYGLVVITIIGVVILFATTVIVAQKLHLIDNARAVLTQTMYEPRYSCFSYGCSKYLNYE